MPFNSRAITSLTFRTAVQDAFAEIALWIAVAQLDRFVFAGGCARRNSRAPARTAHENDVRFNSWIAARIQNFTRVNLIDLAHGLGETLPSEMSEPRAVATGSSSSSKG